MDSESAFSRSEALLGAQAMAALASARVLIVGVGGVGSWCAEALVRTGVKQLTLVDDDRIAPSNLNRQCPATAATLGELKVEAMRSRLAAISPDAQVTAVAQRLAEDEAEFPVRVADFDLVVDAIDSVVSKAELMLAATTAGVPIVSSMGAALRVDPTAVTATRFEKVEGDGLAKALRRQFRKRQRFPGRFVAVWSRELPRRLEERGSLMTVTAAFGMALAAQAIEIITRKEAQ